MTAIDEDELTKLNDELIELRRVRRDNEAEIADLKEDLAVTKRKIRALTVLSAGGWFAYLVVMIAHKLGH